MDVPAYAAATTGPCPLGFSACWRLHLCPQGRCRTHANAGGAQRSYKMASFFRTYRVEIGCSLPIEELLSLIREPEVSAAAKSPSTAIFRRRVAIPGYPKMAAIHAHTLPPDARDMLFPFFVATRWKWTVKAFSCQAGDPRVHPDACSARIGRSGSKEDEKAMCCVRHRHVRRTTRCPADGSEKADYA